MVEEWILYFSNCEREREKRRRKHREQRENLNKQNPMYIKT